MTATTSPQPVTSPTTSGRHDGLVQGLCVTYVVLAAIYIPSAWMILKWQRDASQSVQSVQTALANEIPGMRGALPEFDGMFLAIAILAACFALLLVVLPVLLALRRGYAVCLTLALLLAIVFPVGTVLGVLTIYALLQADIQPQFSRRAP